MFFAVDSNYCPPYIITSLARAPLPPLIEAAPYRVCQKQKDISVQKRTTKIEVDYNNNNNNDSS